MVVVVVQVVWSVRARGEALKAQVEQARASRQPEDEALGRRATELLRLLREEGQEQEEGEGAEGALRWLVGRQARARAVEQARAMADAATAPQEAEAGSGHEDEDEEDGGLTVEFHEQQQQQDHGGEEDEEGRAGQAASGTPSSFWPCSLTD